MYILYIVTASSTVIVYKKAEKLYEQSLEIYKQELGENHLDTVTSYNNLGGVYGRQGKYKTINPT